MLPPAYYFLQKRGNIYLWTYNEPRTKLLRGEWTLLSTGSEIKPQERAQLNRKSHGRTLVRADELFLISLHNSLKSSSKDMAAITVDYRGNSRAESASNEILSDVALSASFILLSL